MPLRQVLLPQKKPREPEALRLEGILAEALSPESLSPALEPVPQQELLSQALQPLERPRLLRQRPLHLSPAPRPILRRQSPLPRKEVLSLALHHLDRPRPLLWTELWREASSPE